MNNYNIKCFADNLHGTIEYSGVESLFIGTPAFNRLHNVLQSSLAYLTYPSNKVKRFEHSIGTMKLSGDIFYHSICNTTDENVLNDFFDTIESEIKEWLNGQSHLQFASPQIFHEYMSKDINLWKVPESNMYNAYLPYNIIDRRVSYLIVFQAIRLCGLLHDIGHLPFSHILEHFLKDLFEEINVKKDLNSKEQFFIDTCKSYINLLNMYKPIEFHEKIGIKLVNNIIENIYSFRTDKSDAAWVFFDVVCFMTKRILNSDEQDCPSIFRDLHLIVSGIIDSDRLDYCNRDLLMSGIKYNQTNYERLFSGYKLLRVDENIAGIKQNHFYFSPDVKHINEVENLINLRWQDFSYINFHHRVHKHEILLEEVLKRLAKAYFSNEDDENIVVFDNSVTDLPLNISSIWKLLNALDKNNSIEHLLIQLDDNWLNTLLKKEFFNLYGTSYISNDNANKYEWNQFHELVSGQKHYYSLLKRGDDFLEIDRSVFEKIREKMAQDKLTNKSIQDYKYHAILSRFSVKKRDINEAYQILTGMNGFIINQLINSFDISFSLVLLQNFETSLNNKLANDNSNISNVVIKKCQFGLGYSIATDSVYVHSKGDAYERLEQKSDQLYDLQKRQSHSPYFHVYFLPKYDKINLHYLDVNKNELNQYIVQCFFEEITEELFKNKL